MIVESLIFENYFERKDMKGDRHTFERSDNYNAIKVNSKLNLATDLKFVELRDFVIYKNK